MTESPPDIALEMPVTAAPTEAGAGGADRGGAMAGPRRPARRDGARAPGGRDRATRRPGRWGPPAPRRAAVLAPPRAPAVIGVPHHVGRAFPPAVPTPPARPPEAAGAAAPDVAVPEPLFVLEVAGDRAVRSRARVSWRRALAAGVTCFALWLVIDAPALLHSAQAAPLGARRTAAITVLRPIAAVSDALGLSHVVSGADRVIGRNNSGVLQVLGPVARRPPGRHADPPPTPVPGPGATTAVTAPDGLPPLPPPSAGSPLRVLVVGDSLGIDFGQALVNDLAATGVVHAVLDGHIDTGLSRPDYFNWPAELQGDLARYQPEAVVAFIGANDPQNFVEGGTALAYGTPAWDAAYGRRVGDFMSSVAAAGARLLWVGMPPMADPALNAKMQVLNGIDDAQAALHRGVSFFASWPVLSDPQGHFAGFLPNASGNEVEVRAPDGTHIAAPGAELLSRAAVADLDHQWGLRL
ncbi:MAG TPA: DUF459 domain-containing protein [Acidimicrobiales bacterium]|nr:DUF459 domain-containing protein [Acidimicrobiales bacterium]